MRPWSKRANARKRDLPSVSERRASGASCGRAAPPWAPGPWRFTHTQHTHRSYEVPLVLRNFIKPFYAVERDLNKRCIYIYTTHTE